VQATEAANASSTERRAGKYLVFHLGREEFGVHVLKVREIMGLQDITAVPQTPPFVKGVINLRGKVIPVIDLRAKFGLEETGYTQRTCIVVVEVRHESGSTQMGAIVDGVSEVLTLQGGEIEDTPEFGEDMQVPYLLGMAKVKGKVKMLLDIDTVLNVQDLRGLDWMHRGMEGQEDPEVQEARTGQ
jgi:purine-binding chemotaxis protein CheW